MPNELFDDDNDHDLTDDDSHPHPANPALVEQSPPDTITVPLTMAERLNMSVRMTLLMEEKKDKKGEVLKLNRLCKNLDKEIEALSTCVRTNCKEVKADDAQQSLLTPTGIGGEAAAERFAAMRNEAEAAQPSEEELAERKRIDGLNDLARTTQGAAGVPEASEGFEASAGELERQSGRKKKKAA